MNDDSVNVWAKLNGSLPEMGTFSICTWVKFTYERIFNQLWSYCNNLETSSGLMMACSTLSMNFSWKPYLFLILIF